jgi:hypothetical protein
MTHKLTKIENYLLVLDRTMTTEPGYVVKNNEIILTKESTVSQRILAHIPLNNQPYLDNVDVLPKITNNELDMLATDWIFSKENNDKWSNNTNESGDNYGSFIAGFKKAREKYKYSQDDVLKVVNHIIQSLVLIDGFDKKYLFPELIYDEVTTKLSELSQPKLPVAFECEYMDGDYGKNTFMIETYVNSEGRTEWIGEYVFD